MNNYKSDINSQTPFISYAQNFEDVLLNRVFKDKTRGFYIDVGALHPSFESVTKAFYNRGWSGINVEPIKDYFNIICQERSRDINLNLALSNYSGNLEFFQIAEQPGNSTLDKKTAYRIAQEKDLEVLQYSVSVKTLADICEQYVNQNIDFLKIDVEGLEEQVISGGDWKKFRPTVLLIETTLPSTNIRCKNNIPIFLEKKGYHHVFFDGINDYYIAQEYSELSKYFACPVNVLDVYLDYKVIEQQRQINKLQEILNSQNKSRKVLPTNLYKLNNKEKVKIAFDISVLGLGFLHERARTGVFRVTEYILKGLIDSPQLELYLCSSIPNLSTACKEYLKNEFQYIDLPLFALSKLRLQNIDLYHSPFYPIPSEICYCRKIITICDLIPIKFPELFEYKEDSLIKNSLKSITDNDLIICISEATKKDALDYDKELCDEQAFVTHLAADKNKFYACKDRSLIDNIHQKYQIPQTPYLLSVCTLEPRKNLVHVIRCFSKLIQEKTIDDLNLVLVGTAGWQYDEIFAELNQNANLRQRIIFTGFVPDEDLAPLYSNALAFLYLSLYEGFGLPPLEAMQCGTPVITSNTSSLPEVVGEAGIMLAPDDVDGLCDAIFKLYMKPDIREALSLKSLEQSEKFTWEKTLQETINIYKLASKSEFLTPSPKIIIDGIFFQLSQNGIARVWKSLLEEWTNNEFGKHIIVLDRAGTAPEIPGIRYRTVPAYSYNNTDADRETLQQVCDEEKADLFISTYYTTPLSTPSVFMAYDMIPEFLGEKLNIPMWQEKHYGINHASAYISISENTACDLVKLFPHVSSELVTVAPCGIQNIFSPANYEEINQFKAKYNISKPYFVLVGDRVGVNGYKNTSLFFNAFSQIPDFQDFEIVCVGSQLVLEPQLRAYVPDVTVHLLKLDDNELRIAYSGAIALVYPSKYEGFGLPVLEAMACGCPVITCPNGSIPEVGGEAVLYVNSDDANELTNKLLDVQQLEVRQSLIAAGLEQAKKFSWSSMAEQVSTALLRAADLPPKKSIDAPISIKELTGWIEQYQQDSSNLSAIERLRQVRKQLADLWLELPAEEIAIAYRSEIGKSHKLLLDSGIRNEQLADSEQAFVTNLLSHIDEELDNPKKAIQYLLALMQYRYASELSDRFDLNAIPHWLIQDYLGFMLFSPTYFQETEAANSYYSYLEQFVNFIHGNILSNSDSQLWQNVATYFAEKANFIPLYFTDKNLKSIYQKRAEIIEAYLQNKGYQLNYEFPERCQQTKKIRLGILAYHFGMQTETFATLPIYKHLNRDLFEVILFPIKMSSHRLERYCAGHSDELIVLPNNLQEQVQTIREADLDILFISTNVTAVTNQITLLASHRLARIQIVDANSPVSTGMRHIDYYISSKLSEPKENAQSHYTESLITLDVPPQCFDFATEEQIVATTSLDRDSLGIDPNAIVYISGANFYKILPEVELTWTKIINQVPNSVLVLYPFNPNWSSSYPVTAFRKRISNTFAKYGLSEERLIILDPAPNRADVQERLKLADIYLDSYPYSGMTSLIDPLQVGLPSIVLEGKISRSQKGASLLRSLQVTDLITDSEETYIQLAVKLGTNSELRKQKSDRIKQKMQQNPSFLDSRSYSAQMGTLFQQLFQQDRANNLIDRLGLRDINLVMFPDWHQSEESLYEDFANVLKTMSSSPDKSRMTLLIDTDGIDGEDANWLFSSVAMNLLMEEAVDIADDLEVSLLDDLSENEWELLLSLLQGRISSDNENQNAIAKAKAESLKIYS